MSTVSPVYCNICVKSGGSALKNRWLTHGARAADFPGAVATVVVARWEGALDKDALDAALNNKSVLPAAQPAIA